MQTSLKIKVNTDPTAGPCPICGETTNPNIGAELFLDDDDLIVCRGCGIIYSPVLVDLLELGDSARSYISHENDFGSLSEAMDLPPHLAVISGGNGSEISTWAKPPGDRYSHYFTNGLSLCGWFLLLDPAEGTADRIGERCAVCRERRERELLNTSPLRKVGGTR
jgi:hypothetical protein